MKHTLSSYGSDVISWPCPLLIKKLSHLVDLTKLHFQCKICVQLAYDCKACIDLGKYRILLAA